MDDKVHVSHYKSAWHYGKGQGSVTLVLADGREQVLDALDSSTFMALNDMLRNERPILWSQAAHAVFTLSEMIGEGEITR